MCVCVCVCVKRENERVCMREKEKLRGKGSIYVSVYFCIHMHIYMYFGKVKEENGALTLVTKNTMMKSVTFPSLNKLVSHHQEHPFPDGSTLVKVPPEVCV